MSGILWPLVEREGATSIRVDTVVFEGLLLVRENRKVYRSGTTSSTMGHEGRKDAYVYAMESKVRKL